MHYNNDFAACTTASTVMFKALNTCAPGALNPNLSTPYKVEDYTLFHTVSKFTYHSFSIESNIFVPEFSDASLYHNSLSACIGQH
jgi:hypothetical protein